MSDLEYQICAKGLRFVSTIKRVDRHKKELDFDRFPRVLRLAVYHHRKGNQGELELQPWTPRSTCEPQRYINRKLEEYLDAVQKIF